MGNNKSCPGQECSSRFLPAEQADVNRLFDALSSEKLGSSASPRSFSLQALKARVTAGSSCLIWSRSQAAADPQLLKAGVGTQRDVFSEKKQIGPTFSLVGSVVGVAAAPLCLHLTLCRDFSHLRLTRGC